MRISVSQDENEGAWFASVILAVLAATAVPTAAQRFIRPAPGQRVQQLVEGYQYGFAPRHDASTAATSSAVVAASTAAFFAPPASMHAAL